MGHYWTEATQCASFYSQGDIYFLHVKLFIFLSLFWIPYLRLENLGIIALSGFSQHWLQHRQGVIYHHILIWLLSTEQRVSAKGRSIYYLGPVSTRTIIPSCSCPQGPTEILVLAVFSRRCPVSPCSHCNTKRPEDSVTHTRAHVHTHTHTHS